MATLHTGRVSQSHLPGRWFRIKLFNRKSMTPQTFSAKNRIEYSSNHVIRQFADIPLLKGFTRCSLGLLNMHNLWSQSVLITWFASGSIFLSSRDAQAGCSSGNALKPTADIVRNSVRFSMFATTNPRSDHNKLDSAFDCPNLSEQWTKQCLPNIVLY